MGIRSDILMAACAATALAGTAAGATPASTIRPADASAYTVKDVRNCMAQNTVARGALRDLSLEMSDKQGKVRDLRMRLFWKPSKTGGNRVNLRITDPPAMLGSSYLLLQEGMGEEVFFYLPGADRALRITGQNMGEPLWGTDFSYGEIKQVLGMLVVGETKRVADAKLGERAVFVLETQTKVEETGYRLVRSYVDQASCVLLQAEFFPRPDKLRKVLGADISTLLQADKYWTVLGYTMSDRSKGTQTKMALTDLSFDERLSEKLFDPRKFYEKPE